VSSSFHLPASLATDTRGSAASARGLRPRGTYGVMLGASVGSAFEALWANRLRSLLTMLGIIIGVAAVIAAVSLTQGVAANVNAGLAGLGTNVLNINTGSANSGGAKTGAGSLPSLTAADAQALTMVPHALNVSPVAATGSQVIYHNQNWGTILFGVSFSYQSIHNWPTSEGTWWSENDEQAGLPVVMLGQTVVNNIFAATGTDPIGQTIRINTQLYRVVGVLSPKGAQRDGIDQDDIVLIPYTTYLRSTGQNNVGQILMQADSAATLDQVQQDATALLEQRHRIASGAPDDFNIRSSTEIIQAQQQSNASFESLLISIAAISLMVGGIGIMNIMLVSVTERTREIGLRMAVGAQPSDIRDQFLVEALTLSVVGGGIGILIGLLAGDILTVKFQFPFILNPFSLLLAFGVAVVVGIAFGLYPAMRASQLDPIVALRIE
jgi:putative ABC transport system permease protein